MSLQNASSWEEARDRLLDFTSPLDLILLEEIACALYSNIPDVVKSADIILKEFQEAPEAWTTIDSILQNAQHLETRIFGTNILFDLVRSKWMALSLDDRNGIRNFIISTILNLSSDAEASNMNRLFLNKLDICLVEILKKEWNTTWSTFIPELVEASKQSESVCQNSMEILMLLSEEVFDFSLESMTRQQVLSLKQQFNKEFGMIFDLCSFVFSQSQSVDLVAITIKSLHRFLSWIPLGYIFETNLIEELAEKFLPYPAFRNPCVLCLSEIAELDLSEYPQYISSVQNLYLKVMQQLLSFLPTTLDYADSYNQASHDDRDFLRNLVHFFGAIFAKHLSSLEVDELRGLLFDGHSYMVALTQIREMDVFMECIDYWFFLSNSIYSDMKAEDSQTGASPLFHSYRSPGQGSTRKSIYNRTLSDVRRTIISRMAKPEEVIIVEDENGNIIRERVGENVDAIQQYTILRDTLLLLTRIDPTDTRDIMLEFLDRERNGCFTWDGLNRLCWAIGSISGAMDSRMERDFLVTVIKELLKLCDETSGKDNKAVIASDIMYVVGQYPQFLKDHWRFLRTVALKLFEFMHETFPGVQEMSVDTFLKISKSCCIEFAILQEKESAPFVVEHVLGKLEHVIRDLEPNHIHVFFEAVGCIISVEKSVDLQSEYLASLMSLPNNQWQSMLNTVASSPDMLMDTELNRQIVHILRTNVYTARGVGAGFLPQISGLFPDMMNLYIEYARLISFAVSSRGVHGVSHSDVKAMRGAKHEILKLMETFFNGMSEKNVQDVAENCIPTLLNAVLHDYHDSVPTSRDEGVLTLITSIITKFQRYAFDQIPDILGAVLGPTLDMINENFQDFQQHRLAFFRLLRAIAMYCFEVFFSIPNESLGTILDSLLFAMRHHERDISETGHTTLLEILRKISNTQYADQFFASQSVKIFTVTLDVLTDLLHKSSLPLQSEIFRVTALALASDSVRSPVFEGQDPELLNVVAIQQHLMLLISEQFPNVASCVTEAFLIGLFDTTKKDGDMRGHVRDFLIETKQFSSVERDIFLQEQSLYDQLPPEQTDDFE